MRSRGIPPLQKRVIQQKKQNKAFTGCIFVIFMSLLVLVLADERLNPKIEGVRAVQGSLLNVSSAENLVDPPPGKNASSDTERDDVCTTRQCAESARRMREAMDLSINPCDDFYQYACGGFEKRHPLNGSPKIENSTELTDLLLQDIFQCRPKTLHVFTNNRLDLDNIHSNITWQAQGIDCPSPSSISFENYITYELNRQLKELLVNENVPDYFAKARHLYTTCTSSLPQEDYRHNMCLEAVLQFKNWSLAVALARKHAQNHTFDHLQDIYNSVNNEVMQLINECAWMDEESKENSVDKAKNITFIAGYEQSILVDHSKPDDPFRESLNPLVDVNFQITSGNLNAIFIPLSRMIPPRFNLGLDVLDFGAMGSTLGHEIMHVFFRSFADKAWTSQTTTGYVERAQCFLRQYSEELEKFIETRKNETHSINVIKSFSEDIADNGALPAAFRAFKKLNSKNQKLEGFKNFTQEQLFFLSFATKSCSSETNEYTEEQILSEKYSYVPLRFRVNLPLKNMKEFADAWSCPRGSEMNPEEKCLHW